LGGALPVQVPSLLADQDIGRLTTTSQDQGLTYVMLGFFVASFIQFPIGYIALQKQQPELPGQHDDAAATCKPSGLEAASPIDAQESRFVLTDSAVNSAAPAVVAHTPSSLQQQQQQQGQQGGVVAGRQDPQHHQNWAQQYWPVLLKGVLTPPVIACLMAIPVGTIPELQQQLFTSTGVLHSSAMLQHTHVCSLGK
jgi:hypothetical protein